MRLKFNRAATAMIFCTLLFVLCTMISVSPLQRQASTPFLSHLPTSTLLELWGGWLPSDLHLATDSAVSQIRTSNIEFALIILLLLVIYACFALIIYYRARDVRSKYILILIGLGSFLAGLTLVFTPAMLSRDLFVYADYGRTIVAHGANPYFVPPARLPHDNITNIDGWRYVTAAYGPLWLYICSFWALLLGDEPLRYIFAFRLMALMAHMCNIVLVIYLLRLLGRSQRIVTLGAFLYGYNPLVLLESSLGAHNDILLVTFMLLGILFCLRAEQKPFLDKRKYLLPAILFTLSALIKFATLPLVIAFFLWLFCKFYRSKSLDAPHSSRLSVPILRYATRNVLFIGLICGLVALILYAPFWIGHSVAEIAHSFFSPPSAYYAENSLNRAFIEWIRFYGLPTPASWTYIPLYLLSSHIFWTILNIVNIGCLVMLGMFCLWRSSTTHTMVLVTLASLEALLLITPWFYPWYVLWIISLAVICLSEQSLRLEKAFIAFALTFSVTGIFLYLSDTYMPLANWALLECFIVFGIPVTAFFLFLLVPRHLPSNSCIRRLQ